MSETTAERFEGHDDRECGEHRTTGSRAWCFDCSEWCYPHAPCKGCELPSLRGAVERVRALIDDPNDRRPEQSRVVHHRWIREALDGPESKADAPSPVSAATETAGGAGETQEAAQ
jgi:hypothetical protein